MKYLSALLPLISALTCNAADDVLRVDFRERTPEMRVVDGLPSGPLVSVLETAAQRVGVELHWPRRPSCAASTICAPGASTWCRACS